MFCPYHLIILVIQAFTFSMDDDMGSDQTKYGVRTYFIGTLKLKCELM